jgi:hypothetical protein
VRYLDLILPAGSYRQVTENFLQEGYFRQTKPGAARKQTVNPFLPGLMIE